MHHWKHSHVEGVQRSTLRLWGYRPKRQTSNSKYFYSFGYCLDMYSKMYIFFHNAHVYFNINKGLWITFFFNRCHKNSHLAFLWILNPAFQRQPSVWTLTLLCETVTPSIIKYLPALPLKCILKAFFCLPSNKKWKVIFPGNIYQMTNIPRKWT